MATITTPAHLANQRKDTPMTQVALTAKGGKAPYTWTVVSGTLPSELTLSASGILSGTPSVAGDYTFTIRAADSSATPVNADKLFYLHIGDVIQITTESIPSGSVGVSYSYPLNASGGLFPYTWRITGGALPKELI